MRGGTSSSLERHFRFVSNSGGGACEGARNGAETSGFAELLSNAGVEVCPAPGAETETGPKHARKGYLELKSADSEG